VSLSLRLRDVNAKTNRPTSSSQVTFRESKCLDNAANCRRYVRIFIRWPPVPCFIFPLSSPRHLHANTRVHACNCECNDDPRGSEKKVITDCSRASPFYSPAPFSLFPPPVTELRSRSRGSFLFRNFTDDSRLRQRKLIPTLYAGYEPPRGRTPRNSSEITRRVAASTPRYFTRVQHRRSSFSFSVSLSLSLSLSLSVSLCLSFSLSLSLSLLLSSLSSVGVALSEPHLDAEIGSKARSSSSSRRAAAANVSQHRWRIIRLSRRGGAPRPVDPLKCNYDVGWDYDSEKLIGDWSAVLREKVHPEAVKRCSRLSRGILLTFASR